jgi:hypothetical protein
VLTNGQRATAGRRPALGRPPKVSDQWPGSSRLAATKPRPLVADPGSSAQSRMATQQSPAGHKLTPRHGRLGPLLIIIFIIFIFFIFGSLENGPGLLAVWVHNTSIF